MEKKNNSFEEIWNKMKECKRVAMSLHSAPDGDSVGSCTAMKYVLERDLGVKVDLVSYDDVSEDLSRLDFLKDVEFGKDISELNLNNYDCILFLDSGHVGSYSGKLKEDFNIPKGVYVINIDHHSTNSYYGNLNYIDSFSPAACSVLVDFFKNMEIKFDKELSERLLLGICTDSGFFCYDTDPEKAIRDAVFLIDNGAQYEEKILRNVLYKQPLRMKRYNALIIDNLKINNEKKFGYSCIRYEDFKKLGLNEAEMRLGINDLQLIKEFDFVFTLNEMENYIKGSFRSKKRVDVSLFAKELGGGGHKPASAFILSKMPLEIAVKKVLDAINKIGIQRYK